jgi:hypothetical protein
MLKSIESTCATGWHFHEGSLSGSSVTPFVIVVECNQLWHRSSNALAPYCSIDSVKQLYIKEIRYVTIMWFKNKVYGCLLRCSKDCHVVRAKPIIQTWHLLYEGVFKSFRTGRLERGLQMVQLSATRCSYIVILWLSLVSFGAITVCIVSQRVFIFAVVYFLIHSVRKLLDTPL